MTSATLCAGPLRPPNCSQPEARAPSTTLSDFRLSPQNRAHERGRRSFHHTVTGLHRTQHCGAECRQQTPAQPRAGGEGGAPQRTPASRALGASVAEEKMRLGEATGLPLESVPAAAPVPRRIAPTAWTGQRVAGIGPAPEACRLSCPLPAPALDHFSFQGLQIRYGTPTLM